MQNDGLLTATYNMGKGVHTVNEPRYNVNDGHYHVARFRRSGANATLQLDTNPPRAISPQGAYQTSLSFFVCPTYKHVERTRKTESVKHIRLKERSWRAFKLKLRSFRR